MKLREQLGLELQEYRLIKDIDLDYLSREMKISKSVISKIESGEDLGPNAARNRLLYKKYIEKIGLDYKEYEEQIKELFPNVVEETINLSNEEILDEIQIRKKFTLNKTILSVLIVLIFAAFVIYLTVYNVNHTVVDTETINETTTLTNTVLEPATITEPKVKDLEVKRVTENEIEVYVEDLKNVKIKIVPSSTVYYDISKDGLMQEQGELTKDEDKNITLKDATNIVINIGLLPATKIYVNDYEITEALKDDLGTQNYITFKSTKEETNEDTTTI